MNEEELKAKEAELAAKEAELQEREGELQRKEEELNAAKADAAKIAETIKKEYEARLEQQKATYEERLREREAVIKQLASGDEPPQAGAFEKLNERRTLQRHY